MDILVNANVSYVLLVLGFLTAVLALFSPGTGILEFGALVSVGLAGYGIVNLPINAWALIFIAVGMAPFFLALILPPRNKVGMMTLASLAFLLGATLLFRRQESWLPAVNPILIILVTPTTLGLTWLLSKKIVDSTISRSAFDLDQLIGMTGQVSSDIRGQGTVYVNGEEWTAESRTFIPEGSQVRVLKRQGLLLEVEPIH